MMFVEGLLVAAIGTVLNVVFTSVLEAGMR